MSDGDCCTLRYFQGDPKEAEQIRRMWDEIFDDPEPFADYYFSEKCRTNRILLAICGEEPVGMIHLNPYEISADKTVERCYYIVGVCVKKEYRERGVMHAMMNRVIADMKAEGCCFTFLMPDLDEYYESLGFERVFSTIELDVDIEELEDEDVVPDDLSGEEGYYAKHMTVMQEQEPELFEKLADTVNSLLDRRYRVYCRRTERYLREMCMEHRCQGGDMVAVFEDGMRMEDGQAEQRLAGMFSYDVYEDTMYVERFESFDEHVRYVLDAAVRLAEESCCRRLVVIMSELHFCDDIVNMLGVSARVSDGKGIMALALREPQNTMEMLHGHCFFDEIV